MIDSYKILNTSFSKKLVFRFGDNSGFFSEFNNLALAVLYCLDHRIQMVLYTSKDALLSIKDGWNDFFEPFCEQVDYPFHKIHNERFLVSKPSFFTKVKRCFYKMNYYFDYYTYELWDEFRADEIVLRHYNIPEMGIDDDFFGAIKKVILMLWNFNPFVSNEVAKITKRFSFSDKYIGLHIRGGDKAREAKIFGHHEYMQLIKSKTDLNQVFVLTDDYSLFLALKADYPEYNFVTSCREDERGYDFYALSKCDKNFQFREYIKLIASMDLLRHAEISFGSYKTNPGMFLGIVMAPGKFTAIDSDRWFLKW